MKWHYYCIEHLKNNHTINSHTLSMNIYQNEHCYFFRKPANIASTYGKQESYMDLIFDEWDLSIYTAPPPFATAYISQLDIHTVTDVAAPELIKQLKDIYTRDQEYGLVNRLDTLTAWFLYFAKTPDIYTRWKELQQQGRIHKHYIAWVDIWTQPWQKNAYSREITTSIAHHKNGKKMLACTHELMSTRRKQKIKGNPLDAMTEILSYQTHPDYPNKKHIQLAHICIQKGRRHQIRCHLASEWEPILGDEIYHPEYRPSDGDLELWSIWCEVKI